MVSLSDIYAARERIGKRIKITPCLPAEELSERRGVEVYLKQESQQRTGSFKARGALNKLLAMADSERKAGVIAASAGNHAQGVAFAAAEVQAQATIVMPETTPIIKIARTRAYGAQVVLHGVDFDDAFGHAKALQANRNLTFVHPFDDPLIIAGQGTCGLEILEQVPDVEAVVVPIGGGGLISGVATAIKEQRPEIEILGVQSESAPAMKLSLDAGKLVERKSTPSIAEGITVKHPGEKTFEIVRKYVDDIELVSESAIERAVFELLETGKAIAEGAGAAPYAALMAECFPQLEGRKVVVLLSGANIDLNILNRIIERSLAKQSRLVRLHIRVQDRPGGLAALLAVVAQKEANVLRIEHHRVFTDTSFWETDIELTLETRDRAHIDGLIDALSTKGYTRIQEVGVPLDPSPIRRPVRAKI